MLAVTDDAANAIKAMIAAQGEEAEGGGLRLAPSQEDPQSGLEVSLAPQPGETDAVVEHSGAKVFLDGELAPQLEQALLDIQEDDEGQLELSLRPQNTNEDDGVVDGEVDSE